MGHTIRKNDDKTISTFNFAINSNLLKTKIEKSTKCRKKNRPNKNVSNAYLYTY